ncbi:MAG: T9SS type A sorting domain-containing protein, partial [Promethearchaeota archaeon]
KYDYVIPVELVSFDIKTENGNVVLNWEVSSELNNHGYIINRWITADSIYQIGFVEGKGTTTEKQFYSFIDKKVNNNRYHYQLVQIDFNGTKNILAQIAINMSSAINSFTLSHNYPNPFNPSTKIKYQIPKLSYVILKVYDVLGNEITILVNEDKSIGSYEEEFDGSGLPSGVYIYKLQAGSFVETKKMVLMK